MVDPRCASRPVRLSGNLSRSLFQNIAASHALGRSGHSQPDRFRTNVPGCAPLHYSTAASSVAVPQLVRATGLSAADTVSPAPNTSTPRLNRRIRSHLRRTTRPLLQVAVTSAANGST